MAGDPAPEYGQKFVLTGPDGTRAVFNDETDVDFVGILDPETSSGLDSPDVREDAADRVEEDGRVQGLNYYSGRPIILGGVIRANTLASRSQRSRKLLRAARAMKTDGTLQWTTEAGTGVSVTVSVRLQQPARITGPLVKKFQVPLVANDPRILSTTTKSVGPWEKPSLESKILAPAAASQEGGAAWTEAAKAVVSDNVYALASPGAGVFTNALTATFSSFAVPVNAVIRGVELRSEQSVAVAGNLESLMRFSVPNDGFTSALGAQTLAATQKVVAAYAATTADVTKTFGTNSDLWGRVVGAITPANLNSGAVKVGIFEKPTTAIQVRVDQLLAVVYYETGLQIENAGDAPATPVIRIYANSEANPYIEYIDPLTQSASQGPRIQFNHKLESGEVGEYVEINLKEGTVIDAKGNDRYGWINFSATTWFTCSPGTTWLISKTSKISAEFKDAWY